MAATIYTNKDCNIASIKRKKLAVIGFGSQGHAHALNLKDSGCDVTIGLYAKSKSRAVAKRLGFKVANTADAVKECDVVMIALPDTVIPEVFEQDILPNLRDGQTLIFAHGFAVHFGFTPIRVVCANTEAMARGSKASKLIRVRHSRMVEQNVERLRDIMNVANQEFEATCDQYRFLASRDINKADLEK